MGVFMAILRYLSQPIDQKVGTSNIGRTACHMQHLELETMRALSIDGCPKSLAVLGCRLAPNTTKVSSLRQVCVHVLIQ